MLNANKNKKRCACSFRFLRAACLDNLKASLGLILAKTSVMRISIPLDLSSRSFIPLRVSFVLGVPHHF
jgi:hypothetical protein